MHYHFLNIDLKAYKIVQFFFAAMSCANEHDNFFLKYLKNVAIDYFMF